MGHPKTKVSEHVHQVNLMRWARVNQAKWPVLKWLFAIPNGGQRNVVVAKKLKAEGVRAGVSDLCLPMANGGFHGLYVELKAVGGRATASQKEFKDFVVEQGYHCVVCEGWYAAAEVIEKYLEGDIVRT